MSEKKEKIIENLHTMRGLAITVLLDLDEENKDGKQFDYCTSPKLSDEFDALNRSIERINDIIYQIER